jgi:hypothetical protein
VAKYLVGSDIPARVDAYVAFWHIFTVFVGGEKSLMSGAIQTF